MHARETLAGALRQTLAEMNLDWPDKLVMEEPKDKAHGDISTNAALVLAKKAGMNPKILAERLAARALELCPALADAHAAGPGFCNFTFRPEFWHKVIGEVEEKGGAFGHAAPGCGENVLVEYVSANPTGPLHVGHGRGAAVGDSVARILRASGRNVSTEYYLNDAGRQMRILGLSIWLNLKRENGGEVVFPEDCYKGGYIRDLARQLLRENPAIAAMPENEAVAACGDFGAREILAGIKADLALFRCEHQRFFSEKSLVDGGAVDKAFTTLKNTGGTYTSDGALWFGSAALGDDRDRVLRKSDGSLTYFASDIAYHHDKFARGYEWLVDVWGADHHGYAPRMRAAIKAMGQNPDKFSVLFIQLVSLSRDSKAVSMSTRAGEFVTLADVIHEVGVDAARFMFLSRSCDSPLDFDLELAKKRTLDNPVYYVQYAHARIAALLRRAAERGVTLADKTAAEDLAPLDTREDVAILRHIAAFEDTVAAAAKSLAPQYISAWLMELAALIHSYYARYTILSADNPALSRARLALLRSVGQTLRNGLFLLGVSAPDTM